MNIFASEKIYCDECTEVLLELPDGKRREEVFRTENPLHKNIKDNLITLGSSGINNKVFTWCKSCKQIQECNQKNCHKKVIDDPSNFSLYLNNINCKQCVKELYKTDFIFHKKRLRKGLLPIPKIEETTLGNSKHTKISIFSLSDDDFGEILAFLSFPKYISIISLVCKRWQRFIYSSNFAFIKVLDFKEPVRKIFKTFNFGFSDRNYLEHIYLDLLFSFYQFKNFNGFNLLERVKLFSFPTISETFFMCLMQMIKRPTLKEIGFPSKFKSQELIFFYFNIRSTSVFTNSICLEHSRNPKFVTICHLPFRKNEELYAFKNLKKLDLFQNEYLQYGENGKVNRNSKNVVLDLSVFNSLKIIKIEDLNLRIYGNDQNKLEVIKMINVSVFEIESKLPNLERIRYWKDVVDKSTQKKDLKELIKDLENANPKKLKSLVFGNDSIKNQPDFDLFNLEKFPALKELSGVIFKQEKNIFQLDDLLNFKGTILEFSILNQNSFFKQKLNKKPNYSVQKITINFGYHLRWNEKEMELLFSFISNFQELKELKFGYYGHIKKGMFAFLSKLKKLEVLHIKLNQYLEMDKGSTDCSHIFEGLNNLKELKIKYMTYTKGSSIKLRFKGLLRFKWPNLERLITNIPLKYPNEVELLSQKKKLKVFVCENNATEKWVKVIPKLVKKKCKNLDFFAYRAKERSIWKTYEKTGGKCWVKSTNKTYDFFF